MVSMGESCDVCGSGAELRVHFYDVAQALAALVDLPDGRRILVDTADSPDRDYCGTACSRAHAHLMDQLTRDLGADPIDLVWITHPHSDHIGGAKDVLAQFRVRHYVDNGRDADDAEIGAVHDEATSRGVPLSVVEPGHQELALEGAGDLKITAIAPSSWLPSCKTDRNACSILLRIDYCQSSILFTGDAEIAEEELVDPRGPATLLQVGHHGSNTSSGAAFLERVQPKYAVISAGRPGEGINNSYCHPRAETVRALTDALGGSGARTLRAFDSSFSCHDEPPESWSDVPASDRLWATERDGDVVLATTGDGVFKKR
ncbi:Competence protein ComEC/Rec2-related protein [Labilithrix luteola]|uniref:Competence protein ComEC/Rec2-related protein n=2 Tax=Labilithrix luteola TaxID=1391654 RepID=A0A0K1PJE4_9BACT|nr:Competence protein ComEC/Rec2-related protein [Labilithrix luteola]